MQGGWRNLARASFSQESIWSSYSPILLLPLVKAPLLMVAGAQDNLCPTFVARKAKMILSALPGELVAVGLKGRRARRRLRAAGRALCAACAPGASPRAWLRFAHAARARALGCIAAPNRDEGLHPTLRRSQCRNPPAGSEYVEFDTTHFGMYMDPILKPNTVVQAAFVKKHLVA